MTSRQHAQQLGRQGGRTRALRLSVEEKRRIAALGGKARAASFAIARRVEQNLRYAAVMRELQPTAVIRDRTCSGRLPGIYPEES
ncbi:MAG TPA: hypothetical protein VNJ02_01660 [Vicinamibacterales bacterium]|nr:hypothetical protein [Vicinamibacterales bacterium]